jgi:hypothetical protein
MALHAQARQLARTWRNPSWAFFQPNASITAFPKSRLSIAEIAAWEYDRNSYHTKSDWHFTTKDARVKLTHLYPS